MPNWGKLFKQSPNQYQSQQRAIRIDSSGGMKGFPVANGGSRGAYFVEPAPVQVVVPDDIGALRAYFGDSQTAGRASGETASHVTAFETILTTLGITGQYYQNGESGRSLPGSVTAYNNRTTGDVNKSTMTMVWFQESGNQNFAGQVTPADLKTTLINYWRTVQTNTPNAKKYYETAFSFGRGPAPITPPEDYRKWDAHNDALREAVAQLATEGITVKIIETDAAIKALEMLMPPADIWFPRGDPSNNEFHYKEPGNLMVAVAGFKAMGRTLTLANLSGITNVSTEVKQKCLTVAEGL